MTKRQLRKKQTQSFIDDLYERDRRRREARDATIERRAAKRMSKAERKRHRKKNPLSHERTLQQLGIKGRFKSIATVIEEVKQIYRDATRIHYHSRRNSIFVERGENTLEILLEDEGVILPDTK